MEPVYTPIIGTTLSLFRVMGWKLDVRGIEHIPASGGGVVATNHVGYLDFTFIGAAVRRQDKRLLRFLAKKELFDHPVAGRLMRGMKHIPVDRAGAAVNSLLAAEDALRAGELIGMFPESTISRSFVPLPAKTGAARMAIDTGAPLIPGAVWGSQRILTKGRPRNFQRGIPVTVAFGPPIDTSPGRDQHEVTDELMAAVGALVDQIQRDYPDAPAGDDDRWWLPAHLGGSAPTPEEARIRAEREAAERKARRQAEGR